jgi:methionyl-tRNA synthetase
LIHATNAFLERHEPWKAEPSTELDGIMGDALEALRIVSILCVPAVPSTAQAVWQRIGMPGDVSEQRIPHSVEWGLYPAGNEVVKGDPLFPRKAK